MTALSSLSLYLVGIRFPFLLALILAFSLNDENLNICRSATRFVKIFLWIFPTTWLFLEKKVVFRVIQ